MDFLIYLYLILFPFGKLTGVLPDLIIFLIAIMNFNKIKFNNFVWVCIFSLFFSIAFFSPPEIFKGLLYLVRFMSYVIFAQIVAIQFVKTKRKKELIVNSLIVVGIAVAVFGWIQYLMFPDLRFLRMFHWDDHYFRLVSTFLDPAFTGIILVLTEILILTRTFYKRNRLIIILNIFLVLTIAFTYSRASFLALFFALLFLFFKFKSKLIIFLSVLFVAIIFVLPKAPSEGTNLLRTYSVGQKFINYDESIKLIGKSPLFGLGFDNLCIAKNKLFNLDNPSSHTCSGLDNSILFIVATTGVVGLIIFFNSILRIVKTTQKNEFGIALFASFIAIFVHGMFTQTFFYNFILGWIAILIGVTRAKVRD